MIRLSGSGHLNGHNLMALGQFWFRHQVDDLYFVFAGQVLFADLLKVCDGGNNR